MVTVVWRGNPGQLLGGDRRGLDDMMRDKILKMLLTEY